MAAPLGLRAMMPSSGAVKDRHERRLVDLAKISVHTRYAAGQILKSYGRSNPAKISVVKKWFKEVQWAKSIFPEYRAAPNPTAPKQDARPKKE